MKRALKEFLATSLTPAMMTAGFSPSGDSYLRQVGTTQYLTVEQSRWATSSSIHFALAVGAAPAQGYTPATSLDALAATGAPLVQRPLAVLSGRAAKGYELCPGTDTADLATHLVADVTSSAIPWFAETATLDGLLEWMARDDDVRGGHANDYIAGLILAGAGRRDEARLRFERADGVRHVIDATMRSLGLLS
ncbi:hypothetical protein [Sphingomonas bacterium]|uniref:hypothetical protein n=1 Tax=Sphingomonas bacterium TaxID=1895847 RepID=UPI001576ABE3|nr:hypothetical protein [Sphingomonas bacterium]